jgi:predicted HTH domain antitoxin
VTHTLQIEYGDDLLFSAGLSQDAFDSEAKFLLAAKLYELDKLSSGRAAKLAGMDRESFLLLLPRYGIPSVHWDRDEIAAEGLPLE